LVVNSVEVFKDIAFDVVVNDRVDIAAIGLFINKYPKF